MIAASQTASLHSPHNTIDVLLISMPFGPLFQPSIGLSSLKGMLQNANISVEIKYLTLKFAEKIGVLPYREISNGNPYVDLAGEWLFSDYLFDGEHKKHPDYIDDVLRRKSPQNNRRAIVSEDYIEVLLRVKTFIPEFIKAMADEILQHPPKIIGFTSTFQQHVASLCLAKAIKAKAPEIKIVMGGANCEGMMGLETVQQFSFVDAVVSGEGEITFPQVVQHFLADENIDLLQGVFTRSNADFVNINGEPLGAIPVREMDMLPVPDYRDFFQQVDESTLIISHHLRVLLETSRGCWWGEHHHCTFCGLNGDSMTYRSKSPERALKELVEIYHTYPTKSLWVVDNILDMKYFEDFMPELAKHGLDLDMFYEVKANLRKEQLVALAEAGIHNLQPGIESLSDHVLKLMKKGVSWLQNVQLLKWSKELGIQIYWNVLWGFPDETVEDYQKMEAVLPYLHHLDPPTGSAQIRLDRFSPNYNEAVEHGFVNVRPAIPYQYIYPFEEQALGNLAYHFFYDYAQTRDVRSYTDPLFSKIKQWRQAYEDSAVFYVDVEDALLVWDFRAIAQQPLTVLHGIQRILYLECDQIQSMRNLKKLLTEHGFELETDAIERELNAIVATNLMLYDNNRYLSLAVKLGTYTPDLKILSKIQHVLENSDMIVLDQTSKVDTSNQLRLTVDYFDIDSEYQPIVYVQALSDLIGYLYVHQLAQPSYETIAGITIDY